MQDIERVSPIQNIQHFEISNNGDRATSRKTILFRLVTLLVIVTTIFYALVVSTRTVVPSESASAPENMMFDHLGRYIMHNFDQKKPMANFLSGLSGLWGVPMVRHTYITAI